MEGDRENLYNYVPTDIEGLGYTSYPEPLSPNRMEAVKRYFLEERCPCVDSARFDFMRRRSAFNAISYLARFSEVINFDMNVMLKHPADLQSLLEDKSIREKLVAMRDDFLASKVSDFIEGNARNYGTSNAEMEEIVKRAKDAVRKLEVYLSSVS